MVLRRPMGAFVKYDMVSIYLRLCGLVSLKTENLLKLRKVIFLAYNSTY